MYSKAMEQITIEIEKRNKFYPPAINSIKAYRKRINAKHRLISGAACFQLK